MTAETVSTSTAAVTISGLRRMPSPGPSDPLPAQDVERLDAIPPGDLLALFPATRPVTDRHLIRTDLATQQLPRHLRLHPEPTRTHVQRTIQLDRHQFEARLE